MLFLNHPLVRAHYLEHGRVYTLRAKRRKREGVDTLVHGSRFKHRTLGKGTVFLVREFATLTPRGLARVLRQSGFKAAKDWIAAYMRFNRGTLILPAHLYLVTKIPNPPSLKGSPT